MVFCVIEVRGFVKRSHWKVTWWSQSPVACCQFYVGIIRPSRPPPRPPLLYFCDHQPLAVHTHSHNLHGKGRVVKRMIVTWLATWVSRYFFSQCCLFCSFDVLVRNAHLIEALERSKHQLNCNTATLTSLLRARSRKTFLRFACSRRLHFYTGNTIWKILRRRRNTTSWT